MMEHKTIPSVSVTYACNGSSKQSNELGMRVMQARAFEKRGEQYLLIKSPPASGEDGGKVKSVKAFLDSDDQVLVLASKESMVAGQHQA